LEQLSGGSEENHEERQCPDRDSNRTLLERMPEAHINSTIRFLLVRNKDQSVGFQGDADDWNARESSHIVRPIEAYV
jgi:hypothetical protein